MQAVVTVTGAPLMPEPAAEKGFKIERLYYTLDGKPADPAKAKQNDRFAVVLQDHRAAAAIRPHHRRRLSAGRASRSTIRGWSPRAIPARCRGSRTPRSRCTPNSATTASPRRSTARASDPAVFTVAYVVRAVSPGNYVLPQAYVEDMYRPDRFGRTGDRHASRSRRRNERDACTASAHALVPARGTTEALRIVRACIDR